MENVDLSERGGNSSSSSSLASINFDSPSLSHVRASRDRCESLYGIDPHSRLVCNRYSQSEVGLRLEKVEEPLARAQPLINEIRSVVKNANYCMLIADDECAAVAEFHDTDLARYLKKQGIAVGTFWDESWVGTNGIGTSTADKAAVTVNGKEHFHNNFHKFICSAAPLIDHMGRRYGALNLTGAATTSQTEVIRVSQFVRGAAAKLHSYVFRDYFRGHRLVAIADERFNDVENMSKLLAVDNTGCVVGVTDALLANMKEESREELMGVPLKTLIGLDYENLLSSEERLHQLEEGTLGGRYALNLPPVVTKQHAKDTRRPGKIHSQNKSVNKSVERISERGRSNSTGADIENSFTLDLVAGTDQCMQKHVALCRRMFSSSEVQGTTDTASIPLLLQGETGTGKDTFARALHAEGLRRDMPYIELNCAAIPDTLIDSELFGYAPGTFTGGLKEGKDGYIVAANGGTLFLDEIGDMPLESQTRLLRVLSERVVQPLGAAKAVAVDFDLICASHRNLQELVLSGQFREDLYYRVCGVKITLSSLRERSDLIGIAKNMLQEIDPQGNVEFSDSLWERISAYPWPGNIRQLKSAIQFIVFSSEGGLATEADLPEDLLHPAPALVQASAAYAGVPTTNLQAAPGAGLNAFQTPQARGNLSHANMGNSASQIPLSKRDELLNALHQTRWCVAEAARVIGVSRATVHRQMKKYEIVRPDHQGI